MEEDEQMGQRRRDGEPKAAGRKGGKPTLEPVRLPADIMKSARIVAAHRGEAVAYMLGDILRPVLAAMEDELGARRARERAAHE